MRRATKRENQNRMLNAALTSATFIAAGLALANTINIASAWELAVHLLLYVIFVLLGTWSFIETVKDERRLALEGVRFSW